jgi:hypothetical protein
MAFSLYFCFIVSNDDDRHMIIRSLSSMEEAETYNHIPYYPHHTKNSLLVPPITVVEFEKHSNGRTNGNKEDRYAKVGSPDSGRANQRNGYSRDVSDESSGEESKRGGRKSQRGAERRNEGRAEKRSSRGRVEEERDSGRERGQAPASRVSGDGTKDSNVCRIRI